MVVLLLVAFAVPVALGFGGALPWMVVLVAEVVVLLLSAWQFDRGRRPGSRAPFLDQDRADLSSPMADHAYYPPKEVIDRPTDRPNPE